MEGKKGWEDSLKNAACDHPTAGSAPWQAWLRGCATTALAGVGEVHWA